MNSFKISSRPEGAVIPPPPERTQQDEDKLINPNYYNGDDVMQIIERYNLSFCLGNVVKYILRAGKKDDERLNQVDTMKDYSAVKNENLLTDLKKAVWYLNREINRISEKGK